MGETGGVDGWCRRVGETGGGDGWWRRVVETGGGDGWGRQEAGGGDGSETGSMTKKEKKKSTTGINVSLTPAFRDKEVSINKTTSSKDTDRSCSFVLVLTLLKALCVA